MKPSEVKLSYETIIKTESENLSVLKRRIFRIGTLRLLVFIAAVAMSYLFWGNFLIVSISVFIAFVIYLFLAKYHSKLFRQKKYTEILIQDAQNELQALCYDFSAFDSGDEYIDPTHSFSLDLDIFGNRSFFQSLNRTVTAFGKSTLAHIVLNPLQLKGDIILRQRAVEELNCKPELIKHFRASGQMGEAIEFEYKSLISQKQAKQSTLSAIFPFLSPLMFIAVVVLCVSGTIPTGIFPIYWLLMIIATQFVGRNIKGQLDFLDKKTDIINTYSALLNIIESEKFSSSYLQSIKEKLTNRGSASRSIAVLRKYCNNMNISFTFAGVVFLNPFFAWNVIFAEKIGKWICKNSSVMGQWFDIVGQFDSLISLGMFAYNHPDYVYPEVIDEPIVKGKNMGHPMMNKDICVCNDIDEPSRPYFMVVTGANMAGKSTYLRTIGINLVLACIGSVVCAESFCFYPFKLVTNLRTSDSLNDNESYFFAELKRLKMIIDRLQTGEELFIILDEILKGTNSEDKQKGSIALMKQLVTLNGCGIIATHDLELGHLETEFPCLIKNYRFEADINGDNLTFSYKMKEGVAQNMNACFLMKKMGITIDE